MTKLEEIVGVPQSQINFVGNFLLGIIIGVVYHWIPKGYPNILHLFFSLCGIGISCFMYGKSTIQAVGLALAAYVILRISYSYAKKNGFVYFKRIPLAILILSLGHLTVLNYLDYVPEGNWVRHFCFITQFRAHEVEI